MQISRILNNNRIIDVFIRLDDTFNTAKLQTMYVDEHCIRYEDIKSLLKDHQAVIK